MKSDGEIERKKSILYDLVPIGGASVGNVTLLKEWRDKVKADIGLDVVADEYWEIRNELIMSGRLTTGRGGGGSVYRADTTADESFKSESRKLRKEEELYPYFKKYLSETMLKTRASPISLLI